MNRNTVNRKEQPCKFLSARLTQRQFKQFQEILRNYNIHKSNVSDQLRELLRQDLRRSRKYASKEREFRKKLRAITQSA